MRTHQPRPFLCVRKSATPFFNINFLFFEDNKTPSLTLFQSSLPFKTAKNAYWKDKLYRRKGSRLLRRSSRHPTRHRAKRWQGRGWLSEIICHSLIWGRSSKRRGKATDS
uniref:Uncharacterized protein n=1 Tax=Amphimedon queenslandica TaxID=400682 RepID=A0A1X7V311_AMPQE